MHRVEDWWRAARRSSALLVAGLLPLACGVVFDAPTVTMIIQDDGIVYADADGSDLLVGGETVLVFRNRTKVPRQVVLARVDDCGSAIPEELKSAEAAREDDRILGYSRELDPEESQFGAGGIGVKIDDISFHVYMEPGRCHVAFDTISDRLVAWLQPPTDGQARS